VKNTAFTSFSVVGLVLLLGVGLLVILLSVFIEIMTGHIQRYTKRDPYSLVEWNTNGILQLQRLAYEELGLGQWDGCGDEIPYTKGATELEALNLSDPNHPRIIVPNFRNDSFATVVAVSEDVDDKAHVGSYVRRFDSSA
jgi:hypothetical protein